jgi:hypothetical protein
MNDNVTYGYLVPLLMNICFWYCVYLVYCWHDCFFAIKSYFDEFNIRFGQWISVCMYVVCRYVCICVCVFAHVCMYVLWRVRVAPLIICGLFDRLHRFIGSHIQACLHTQPIINRLQYPFRSNGFIALNRRTRGSNTHAD